MGFKFGIEVLDSRLGFRFGIQVLYSGGGFRVKIQVWDESLEFIFEIQFWDLFHPRPQAQARAALTVALGQAVDLRRNSDAEAWSHSICYFSLKTWRPQ